MTSKIDFFFDIVFSILLFSLSFSIAIPNILLGVLPILFLLKKQKRINFNKYTVLILVFVSYIILKSVFFGSFIENIALYKFLLLLPIFSFFVFKIYNIKIVIKGYIFGVFFSVLTSAIKTLNYYLEFNRLPFGNTAEVSDLIYIHRPYFGFMCFLAIVLIHFLSIKIISKRQKMVYYIMAFIIALFLYIIVARLALFLLFIYVLVNVLIYLNLSKTKLFVALISFTLFFLTFLNLNSNLKNRLHIKSTYNETIKVLKNQEPRFVIWGCIFNQINNNNFLFGYNNRKLIQQELNQCYKEEIQNISKRKYYLEIKFNSHNQFFDFFLDGGIVGVLLYLSLFLFLGYSFKDNFNAIFFLFALFLFAIVENILHRQIGCFLFGIFIPLFCKMITFEKE